VLVTDGSKTPLEVLKEVLLRIIEDAEGVLKISEDLLSK
jgi:hypothetical protein